MDKRPVRYRIKPDLQNRIVFWIKSSISNMIQFINNLIYELNMIFIYNK